MAYTKKNWFAKNWAYIVGGVVAVAAIAYYFVPTVKTFINTILGIK